MIKQALQRLARRCGYVVWSVGSHGRIRGIDLLRDVHVLLAKNRPVTLFDVGANVGQTVAALLETFAQPRIYAFEPSPATFKALAATHGDNDCICLENIALGEQDGVLPFHVTKACNLNDSILEPRWQAHAQIVPVQVKSLDRYCQDREIEAIDYLKIDVQGYDLAVLRGARRLLRDHRVRAFSVEITFASMYKNQPSYLDIFSFTDEVGYKPLGFYDQTCSADNELGYLNVLFVPGEQRSASTKVAQVSDGMLDECAI